MSEQVGGSEDLSDWPETVLVPSSRGAFHHPDVGCSYLDRADNPSERERAKLEDSITACSECKKLLAREFPTTEELREQGALPEEVYVRSRKHSDFHRIDESTQRAECGSYGLDRIDSDEIPDDRRPCEECFADAAEVER